jgi:hypothetical protein
MIVIYSSSLLSTTGSVFEVFEAISNHNQSFGTAALGWAGND